MLVVDIQPSVQLSMKRDKVQNEGKWAKNWIWLYSRLKQRKGHTHYPAPRNVTVKVRKEAREKVGCLNTFIFACEKAVNINR